MSSPGRVIGIDLGTKRIGVAISDSDGALALPYDVVQRSGDRPRDHGAIKALVEEAEGTLVVVGLPLSLDGSVGRAAQAALDEADELRSVVGVPVETFDERLTTVSADRSLMQMKMKADARRRVVDKVAAAVMLQAWLDARRRRP
ncbi:MAG TPA: Holliday junction resolvase RuvX [Acidimicrobiales bacterium]|nr:Holliday junction resolvase RuvX [Acidimicrobiales bacterium]